MNKCPKCNNERLTGIEYRYGYDGVSEWRCDKCNTRYGRWSGKVLTKDETEPVYGGKNG